MRYETKVTEVEQTIKELVSRNQELSEQLAAYQALSEDLPGPGDELEIEAQSDRQQSLSARDENVKIRAGSDGHRLKLREDQNSIQQRRMSTGRDPNPPRRLSLSGDHWAFEL